MEPDYAAAYVHRGTAKDELDDLKGAIEDYDEAVRLKPIDDALAALAYLKRAEAKLALGENRAAVEDYDEVIHLKPSDAKAYYKRGRAKAGIGNISEAKADLQTALKLVAQEKNKMLKTNIEETLRHLD